jgi:hypothetical protein
MPSRRRRSASSPAELVSEILVRFVVGRANLTNELPAAIDQSDDVREIAAGCRGSRLARAL